MKTAEEFLKEQPKVYNVFKPSSLPFELVCDLMEQFRKEGMEHTWNCAMDELIESHFLKKEKVKTFQEWYNNQIK